MITPRFVLEERVLASLAAKGVIPPRDEPGIAQQEPAKPVADTALAGATAEALALIDEPAQASAEPAQDKNLPPDMRVPESNFGYRLAAEPQQRDQAGEVGAWFRAVALPVRVGNFIAQAAELAGREPMKPDALKRATTALHANLQRAWGDSYRANLDTLTAEINRIDQQHNGKVWEFLNAHPEVLTSPTVVKRLTHHLIHRNAR